MSRRRNSRASRHSRRLRYNPLTEGRLNVVPVNTFRLSWAARAYEAILKNGGKAPKWLLGKDGKIPNFGVLSEETWGNVVSPDGLTWMQGVVDLFDRVMLRPQNLRVGQKRPTLWGGTVETTRMDTQPARLMGEVDGKPILFVVGGAWTKAVDKREAGEGYLTKVFPFYPKTAPAMKAIDLGLRETGESKITFLFPHQPGSENPESDVIGVDAFNRYFSTKAKGAWLKSTGKPLPDWKMEQLSFLRFFGVPGPGDVQAQEIAAKRWGARRGITIDLFAGKRYGQDMPTLEELAFKYKSVEAKNLLSALTVAGAQEAMATEDKATIRAFEKAGRVKEPAGKGRSKKSAIPWSAVEHVVIAAYGYRPQQGDYGMLAPKSVVLTRDEVFRAYAEAQKNGWNPMVAVVHLADQKGLGLGSAIKKAKDAARTAGKAPVMPFEVIASVVACPRIPVGPPEKRRLAVVGWRAGVSLPDLFLSASRTAPDLPVYCDDSPLKVFLAQLYLPYEAVEYEKKNGSIGTFRVPSIDPREESLGGWSSMSARPRRDVLFLTGALFGARVMDNGSFKVGNAKGGPFTRGKGYVTNSEMYKRVFAKTKGKGASREERSYIATVNLGLGKGRPGTSATARAGAKAQTAVGGMAQQGKWAGGRVAARRAGEHVTRDPRSFDSIYSYAARLLEEESHEVKLGKGKRAPVDPRYGVPVDLLRAMERAGVRQPEPGNTADVVRALKDLKATVQTGYESSFGPDHGDLVRDEEDPRSAYLAQLNPRRKRRNPRRPRYRDRRNPKWSADDAAEVRGWLKDPNSDDPKALQKSREALFGAETVDIVPGVERLFQTQAVKKEPGRERRGRGTIFEASHFAPGKRIVEGPAGEVVGYTVPPESAPGTAAYYSTEMYPFRMEGVAGEEALSSIKGQLPLSVSEVEKILERQATSRRDRRAMQASSALCALHRTRKIDYRLSPGLTEIVGRDTLLLMSPEESEPRVMTYKRGVHMDCDMKGPDMGRLLGQAIQAALLWYADKPTRRVGGKLWVSRVGDNRAIEVWSSSVPSDPISLSDVARNLSGGIYVSFETSGDEAKRYERAVRALAGRATQRERRVVMREFEAEQLPMMEEQASWPETKLIPGGGVQAPAASTMGEAPTPPDQETEESTTTDLDPDVYRWGRGQYE